MSLISPALKILICPFCHGELKEDEAASKLRCTKCGLGYPVQNGIPIMLVDQAEKPADNKAQKE